MRIAIASSGLGHVARGIESWAADLAAILRADGYEVRLFKGSGTADHDYEQVIGCARRDGRLVQTLHRWLPQRFFWRIGAGSPYAMEQLTFAVRLVRAVRQWRADVVHVQDPMVALLLQHAWRLGRMAARIVLAHGTEEPLHFLRKIHYVQHLAPWHLEEVRQQGCSKPTWTAIPNFIDTERFRPGASYEFRASLGIPAHALIALSCAAIKAKHKRIDYLIEEVSLLRKQAPDLPLWLIVAGSRAADTEGLVEAATNLLGDRVRFLVDFPRQRMPELYRAADLFVLCSLKEMMPIALLEAIASALPCLFHRHPVMEWMAGPAGYALDLRHRGALTSALIAAANCPAERWKRGAAGRRHCVDHFEPHRVVRQIIGYYHQIQSPGDQVPHATMKKPVPCSTAPSA